VLLSPGSGFMPAVYTGLAMWAIGVYTLLRMVNFKF
jgi:hypothetical protein